MATRAPQRKLKTLTPEQKLFLIVRLAKFETPKMVRAAFAKQFPKDPVPEPNVVARYDAATKAGAALSAEHIIVFKETRADFLKSVKSIPVANKAVRLNLLNTMVFDAIDSNNRRMAAEFLEQAAKESGDAFTNKVDMKHSGSINTNTMSDADLIRGLARFGIALALPNAGGSGA